MVFTNAVDAIRSAMFFAEHSRLVYAIYASGQNLTVKQLIQANGLELERIKP